MSGFKGKFKSKEFWSKGGQDILLMQMLHKKLKVFNSNFGCTDNYIGDCTYFTSLYKELWSIR